MLAYPVLLAADVLDNMRAQSFVPKAPLELITKLHPMGPAILDMLACACVGILENLVGQGSGF